MLRRKERLQTAAVVAVQLHHETKNVLATGILLFHLGQKKVIFLTLGLFFRRAAAAAHFSTCGLDPFCLLWDRRRLMERSLYAQLATERTLTNDDDGEQELVGVGESLNPGLFIWPGHKGIGHPSQGKQPLGLARQLTPAFNQLLKKWPQNTNVAKTGRDQKWKIRQGSEGGVNKKNKNFLSRDHFKCGGYKWSGELGSPHRFSLAPAGAR